MKKQDLIAKYFKQENLAKCVAEYQLYYQISLGTFINKSSFDNERLEELDLDISPEHVFNTMMEIIKNFHNEKDFEEIFDDNIKVNAFIHALKDFTSKNQDLDKEEKIYDTFYEKIMNDEFYNVSMHILFEEEFKNKKEYWSSLISKKTARELKESALKM